MDDTEAEAALLALGPQLEWRGSGPRHDPNTICSGWVDSSFYIIQSEEMDGACDQAGFLCILFRRIGGDITGPVLLNQAEAKAACERHYATGKWD